MQADGAKRDSAKLRESSRYGLETRPCYSQKARRSRRTERVYIRRRLRLEVIHLTRTKL